VVEVSEFTIKDLFSEEGEFSPKLSRLPQKIRKEAKQLYKVTELLNRAGLPSLPLMVVLYDPVGLQTHPIFLMQKLLGLSIAVPVNPFSGEAGEMKPVLTEKGSLFAYKSQNAHLSAIGALKLERVNAQLSGFEKEVRTLGASGKGFAEFFKEYQKIYQKYLRAGIDVFEEMPVLEIYQNPCARIPWRRELWGRFDKVWGLIDNQAYGLVHNGLLLARAGVLKGVSLPDPIRSSRASGFYDE